MLTDATNWCPTEHSDNISLPLLDLSILTKGHFFNNLATSFSHPSRPCILLRSILTLKAKVHPKTLVHRKSINKAWVHGTPAGTAGAVNLFNLECELCMSPPETEFLDCAF